MRTSRITFKRRVLGSLFLLLLLPGINSAQRGYSSASYAMSKMRASQGHIPAPDEVRVEEHVNYHKHQLPLPSKGEAVHMDLRWGNERIGPASQSAILQVGLTTEQVEDLSSIPPVNVALVIDKSGSMNGARISKARKAALAFVDRLRPKDRISIVAFNHNVHTVLPSHPASDKQRIRSAIRSIRAGGSTDLNSGLIEGYRQVASKYEPGGNSKLIMLTDALTNTGITAPRSIVRNSQAYNKNYDIGISMIGVGVNFNDALSRQLTGDARTSIHFINDAADIQKVFIDEVESLLSPKARNVQLELSYGARLQLEQVYGYTPKQQGKRITLDLKRMNSGLTQVVLAKFRPVVSEELCHQPAMGKAGMEGQKWGASSRMPLRPEDLKLEAKLSYYDMQKQERVTLRSSKSLRFDENAKRTPDKLADPVVKKNYSIAYLAQGLKEMAKLNARGDRQRAEQVASQRLDAVRKNYGAWNSDQDLKRVVDLLEQYLPQQSPGLTSSY